MHDMQRRRERNYLVRSLVTSMLLLLGTVVLNRLLAHGKPEVKPTPSEGLRVPKRSPGAEPKGKAKPAKRKSLPEPIYVQPLKPDTVAQEQKLNASELPDQFGASSLPKQSAIPEHDEPHEQVVACELIESYEEPYE